MIICWEMRPCWVTLEVLYYYPESLCYKYPTEGQPAEPTGGGQSLVCPDGDNSISSFTPSPCPLFPMSTLRLLVSPKALLKRKWLA